MPSVMVRVFVSATTNDLGKCREAVSKLLHSYDIFPVTQEHLPPDYRSLIENLEDHIRSCDAVICLVGNVFGAAPMGSDSPRRSYTQLEYDVARRCDKPVFIFLAHGDFCREPPVAEPPELLELQQQHRNAVMQVHKCGQFASDDELRAQVSLCIPKLQDFAGKRKPDGLYLLKPPSFFAGRVCELKQLTDALFARTPAVIAVLGMGGQGKTTLVREAIEKLQVIPFATGFVCTAYRAGFSFDNFLDAVLTQLLKDTFDKRSIPQVSARVDRLLAALQEKPTLVVIDGIEHWLRGWNVGDRDLRQAEAMEQRIGHFVGLDEFLLAVAGLSNGSHLVLTTRAIPAVLDQVACTIVPLFEPGAQTGLKGLDDDAAERLLRELNVKGSSQQLREAARVYANHPFALEILAGFLKKRAGGKIERAPTVTVLDPNRRLFELFELTRRNLPGRPSAERFLQIASHFIEDPPLSILAAAWCELRSAWTFPLSHWLSWFRRSKSPDEQPFYDLAVSLADWHLLHFDHDERAVRLHPLMKTFFVDRTPNSRRLHRRLAQLYERKPLSNDAQSLADARPRQLAIEHWLRAGRADRGAGLFFARLTPVHSYVEWLATWGHHASGAELLGRVAVELRGVQRAELLNVRGALLRELGETQEALAALDEAVALAEQSARHRTLRHQRLLGCVYLNRGNLRRQLKHFTAALEDYDRGIRSFERSLPWFPSLLPQLANSIANRANVLRDMGKLSPAIREYDRALVHFDSIVVQGETRWESLSTRVRLNRAITLADKWDHVCALPAFESVVATLDESIRRGQTEFAPTLAYARTTWGLTLSDAGKSTDGLRELDAGIAVLRSLVEAGRRDLEERLAAALLDRTLARARVLQWSGAESDAEAATAILSGLERRAQHELQGYLKYADVLQALSSLGAHDGQVSPADGADRIAVLRRLTEQGHLDLRAAYVRASLLIVSILLGESDTHEYGVNLLCEAVTNAEDELRRPEPREAIVVQLRHSLEQLAHGLPEARLTGAVWEAVQALCRRVSELCDGSW